jgi:hypothetical protein
MKHNSRTQSDTTLKFDGAERETTGRINQRMMTNQWSGHMNDGRLVQKAQAPNRRGNDGSCDTPGNLGASVTKDSNRKTMTSPMPSLPAQGSVRDNINRGSQYRGQGGVMAKSPSNPDRIRVGQSGGGSFNREGPSKTPATRGGETNFNFGVKKQY